MATSCLRPAVRNSGSARSAKLVDTQLRRGVRPFPWTRRRPERQPELGARDAIGQAGAHETVQPHPGPGGSAHRRDLGASRVQLEQRRIDVPRGPGRRRGVERRHGLLVVGPQAVVLGGLEQRRKRHFQRRREQRHGRRERRHEHIEQRLAALRVPRVRRPQWKLPRRWRRHRLWVHPGRCAGQRDLYRLLAGAFDSGVPRGQLRHRFGLVELRGVVVERLRVQRVGRHRRRRRLG